MPLLNQQFVLASRPKGEPSADNFRLQSAPVPELADGQVLVRHHYLSLDPYMRGRMSARKSYAEPQPLDAVMIGGTAGEVVASRANGFAEGDLVVGMGGWQEYSVVNPDKREPLQVVDTTRVPLSAYLGPLGMPGVTAWVGLQDIIAPKPGETVLVSSASGAVGSVVGQLARQRGCRAVGIAGGPDKCAYVVDTLGFDACVDYKAHTDLPALAEALAAACPDGIDGNFENVGGRILDAVMLRMNAHGRIALCGMIAGYNGDPQPMAYPGLLLTSRLSIEGFIVTERMARWGEALRELVPLVAGGTLKYSESIAQGLEAAPEAFLGLFSGANLGKQLVKLA